jgi:hypothetical protein
VSCVLIRQSQVGNFQSFTSCREEGVSTKIMLYDEPCYKYDPPPGQMFRAK